MSRRGLIALLVVAVVLGGAVLVSAVVDVYSTRAQRVIESLLTSDYHCCTVSRVAFTGLASYPNGTIVYCTNCDPSATIASCASSGTKTGAFAYRVNGAWQCAG